VLQDSFFFLSFNCDFPERSVDLPHELERQPDVEREPCKHCKQTHSIYGKQCEVAHRLIEKIKTKINGQQYCDFEVYVLVPNLNSVRWRTIYMSPQTRAPAAIKLSPIQRDLKENVFFCVLATRPMNCLPVISWKFSYAPLNYPHQLPWAHAATKLLCELTELVWCVEVRQ